MSVRATVGLLLGMLVVIPAVAQERLGDPGLFEPAAARPVPSIATELVSGSARWSDADTRPALLEALSQWLAADFDLPSTPELPSISYAPPAQISAMRYGALLSSAARENASRDKAVRDDTIAIYIDRQRRIYLPESFTGSTPAELSILVHEMVHHMQNMARLHYDCPQTREKTAYLAQQRWLKRFGRDLAGEFQIDPFTVFVRSACIF